MQTFPAAACDGSADGANALGTVVTVPIRDANCLSLLVSPSGSISLWAVTAAPGWADNVKRAQGDQIDVIWSNVANRLLTHEYRRSGARGRRSPAVKLPSTGEHVDPQRSLQDGVTAWH